MHLVLPSNAFRCHVPSVGDGLTHWGRATHICVAKLTTIGSDNGLSPGRRQAIIWTIAGIFLIGPLGTNFSEILIEILTFSFKKMRLKVSSAKRRPFCLGLNKLIAAVTGKQQERKNTVLRRIPRKWEWLGMPPQMFLLALHMFVSMYCNHCFYRETNHNLLQQW